MCQISGISAKYFVWSTFEHSGCHIIYVKSNSKEVYFWQKWFSSKIRQDRRLQSWPLEKKLLNFQNRDFLYRKSYSKFDAFWGLSINLVFFFEWSTLKSSIFANFWWKLIYFFTNRSRISFGINNVSLWKARNAIPWRVPAGTIFSLKSTIQDPGPYSGPRTRRRCRSSWRASYRRGARGRAGGGTALSSSCAHGQGNVINVPVLVRMG